MFVIKILKNVFEQFETRCFKKFFNSHPTTFCHQLRNFQASHLAIDANQVFNLYTKVHRRRYLKSLIIMTYYVLAIFSKLLKYFQLSHFSSVQYKNTKKIL